METSTPDALPDATIGELVPNHEVPRIWPIPLMMIASLASYLFASAVAVIAAAFVVNGSLDPTIFRDESFIQSLMKSRIGFPIIVFFPQFAMIIPVLIGANLSAQGFTTRLNLVRGQWPIWLWFMAAFATPLIGIISSAIVGSFMEESELLNEMTNVFRGLTDEGFLIPLAFLIGATPGICEELLFRGYIQSRLTTRWTGPIGILLTSIVFAAFHMDLVHSTAVFALGVWLGWICWHSGSIFPAMLAHFVNNAFSVLAVSVAPEKETNEVSLGVAAMMLVMLMSGIGSLSITLTYAMRHRRPRLQSDLNGSLASETTEAALNNITNITPGQDGETASV